MKLAFVVPWFGKGISGGAESETIQTIEHLVAAGYAVEVFTTCIKDFHADWGQNFHKSGTTVEAGITVHRYPVLPRNKADYDLINQKIIGRMRVTPEEEVTFANEFLKSPELLQALYREKDNYLFFFIPYLFPSTYDGVNIVGRNSVVIPCLHDEGYAFLSTTKQMMEQAGGLVYHTHSEQLLAEQSYNLSADQFQTVLGVGVGASAPGDPDAFAKKYGIDTQYVLYAGRKAPGKNTPQLVSYWNDFQWRSGNADHLKLVMIGPGRNTAHLLNENSLIDLDYLSEADKRNAFAGAMAFCHPSAKESFSLVLMESWLARKPVLVNGFSPVLVEHVKLSNGGLYYANVEEFIGMLDWLIDHPEEAGMMGENGRQYVKSRFSWDVIIRKYVELIDQMAAKHGFEIERNR